MNVRVDHSSVSKQMLSPQAQRNDRPLRQMWASSTAGTSPISTVSMIADWAMHLACSPDKQVSLFEKGMRNWSSWWSFVAKGCPAATDQQAIQPQRGDRRFNHPGWQQPAYAALSQAFLLAEDFADHATSDVPGLSADHDRAMTFLARQIMDAFSPSNFLASSPEVIERTVDEYGMNLLRGVEAFAKDVREPAQERGAAPPKKLGQDIAATPGKVVYRNHLIELIQYEAASKSVHAQPVLITPAWIMKYYILDLSAENSLVQFLTKQGFTVFMISWRNPGAADADLGMAEYLSSGPIAALDYIEQALGVSKVHTVGYCLGGTLLAIAAAKMARDGDDRLASMTLLAAQTDFSEAGELMLFINESQVSFLEDKMAAQGYLDSQQMMGAFQFLRSNDLIWSKLIRAYLLGEDPRPMNDLMQWNADGTRMPAKMHAQYLRQLFLNNDLAAGRYKVDGHAVSLRDIRVPIFGVGTETDHIAPWTSVFKIHNLAHSDITFVLTNGGHNAGVISEPGHRRRHYRMHTVREKDRGLSSEDWLIRAAASEGSWWPAWTTWLAKNSTGKTAPPDLPKGLCDAPGTYVLME
ncbi:MAG: alpha/beta fold hydrolase [Pseudomonadota bacterium]